MAGVRFRFGFMSLVVVGATLVLTAAPALSDDVLAVKGSAYGERILVTPPTGTRVSSGPMPTVKLRSSGGEVSNSLASVDQPGLLSTGVLTVTSEGALGPEGFVRSSAEVAGVSIVDGAVAAEVVRSECESTTAGSIGSTTLVGATVLGATIEVNPAPNTVIPLPGIGTLTLNEQRGRTTYTDGRTTLTVNAVRLQLDSSVLGTGDIIVASSTCSISPPASGGGGGGPLSGSAFGERIRVTLPVGTKVASGPLPSVTLPSTGGSLTRNAAGVDQPDLLSTGALTVSTDGTVSPSPQSHSFAEVAGVDVATGAVTAEVVRSECNSTVDGSSGTTTLVGAEVFGSTISAEPAPNTTIELAGLGTLILNEQTGQLTTVDGKTSITINAVHLILDSPTKGTGDIIVAQSHCDVLVL